MTSHEPNIDDLENFIVEQQLPKAEAIKILKSFGVDTTDFFTEVDKAVQLGYSDQLRKLADREKSARLSKAKFQIQLSLMSREAMISKFKEVSDGKYGMVYRDAAVARCRNKTPSEFTDEELRTWLEDIGEILGESTQ